MSQPPEPIEPQPRPPEPHPPPAPPAAGELPADELDQPPRPTQAARDQGRAVADTAREDAHELADSAREQAGEVADTAVEEASRVAGEAAAQGRRLLDETSGQLQNQARQQTERVATSLHRLSDQVSALADGRPDEAGEVEDYARQAGQSLSRLADRLDTLGFDGVVDELGRFARRRPGAFLLGAAAAGFAVGRFARNAGGGPDSAPRQAGGPEAAGGAPIRGADVPAVTVEPRTEVG